MNSPAPGSARSALTRGSALAYWCSSPSSRSIASAGRSVTARQSVTISRDTTGRTRLAVEVGFALTLLGHLDNAAELLGYLATRQSPDGHWGQNFFPDGTPFWTGLQLDETALPVMLAAKLDDLGQPPSETITAMINAAKNRLESSQTMMIERWPSRIPAARSRSTAGVIDGIANRC